MDVLALVILDQRPAIADAVSGWAKSAKFLPIDSCKDESKILCLGSRSAQPTQRLP